jgi:hypothetical protein
MEVAMIKYRVNMIESERGWGQSYFYRDFDTYDEAKEYIRTINEHNNAEFKELQQVPAYYVQPCSDKITAVEINEEEA